MKVAYCFSGQLRNFKSIYPNLKENILDPTGADVYAFLWEWDDSVPKRFEDEGTIGEFVDLYKPKHVEIGSIKEFFSERWIQILIEKAKENKRPEITPENVIAQYWGWFSSFCLTGDEEAYDVYIKGRSEVTFARPISKQELNIAKNMLIIPKGHDSFGINDVFCAGDYYHMLRYMLIYNNVYDFMKEGVVFHPETMMKHNLKREIENGEVYRFDFPLYLRGEDISKVP